MNGHPSFSWRQAGAAQERDHENLTLLSQKIHAKCGQMFAGTKNFYSSFYWQQVLAGGQIWNDRGSGGPDGAFWHLPDTDGTLCVLSSNTHARPAAQFPTWAEDLTLEIEALR
eukprot:g38905.t1